MKHYQSYDVPMDKEIFTVVKLPGFSNYMVSNYGTVMNSQTKHIMKWQVNSTNHYYVQLTKKNVPNKKHNVFVHRLVAFSFMKNPNPQELDSINHIDENPHNNHLDNLEFCDREWNANWGTIKQRTFHTLNKRGLLQPVYAINKNDLTVSKFDSIVEASQSTGISKERIGQVLRNQSKKIGGDYVFCKPNQYTRKHAINLINNSKKGTIHIVEPICVISVDSKSLIGTFSSLKQLGLLLHISADNVFTLVNNPTLPNPYSYVFCKQSQYSPAYVDYLLKVYTKKEAQAVSIVGMNINTGEILHFKSIKQAEHQLVNQSVRPYMQGKVKSAKDWVFCKESEYTKKLLQQKAKEAKPHNNFEIVILNCKTGESFKTSSDVKTLAKRYKVSDNTIRNQLNHNALSINGQQFIYADKYNEDLKQVFMESYKKKQRGKAVYAINIDTLEITKYESATDAAEKLGISRDQILSVIRGNSNQTHRYAFSYENYYSKYRMYQLAYFGKYGKAGFPVSSVDSNGKQTFYPAVKEASKQTGVTRNNIFKVLRDEHGSAGGYNWFKEDRDKYLKSLLKD